MKPCPECGVKKPYQKCISCDIFICEDCYKKGIMECINCYLVGESFSFFKIYKDKLFY